MEWEEEKGRATRPGSAEPDAASCGKQQLDTHTRMHSPTPFARAGQLGRGGWVWAQASAKEGTVADPEA